MECITPSGRQPETLGPDDLVVLRDDGRAEGTLVDQIRYVDALLESLDLGEAVIVAHDWGVAIAMERIRRFPDQVKAIAFMEAHLRPLPGWEAFDAGRRGMFTDLRTPSVGERMVLEENFFLDTLLPRP